MSYDLFGLPAYESFPSCGTCFKLTSQLFPLQCITFPDPNIFQLCIMMTHDRLNIRVDLGELPEVRQYKQHGHNN